MDIMLHQDIMELRDLAQYRVFKQLAVYLSPVMMINKAHHFIAAMGVAAYPLCSPAGGSSHPDNHDIGDANSTFKLCLFPVAKRRARRIEPDREQGSGKQENKATNIPLLKYVGQGHGTSKADEEGLQDRTQLVQACQSPMMGIQPMEPSHTEPERQVNQERHQVRPNGVNGQPQDVHLSQPVPEEVQTKPDG